MRDNEGMFYENPTLRNLLSFDFLLVFDHFNIKINIYCDVNKIGALI